MIQQNFLNINNLVQSNFLKLLNRSNNNVTSLKPNLKLSQHISGLKLQEKSTLAKIQVCFENICTN